LIYRAANVKIIDEKLEGSITPERFWLHQKLKRPPKNQRSAYFHRELVFSLTGVL
jgi:hypothetical protein